MRNPENNTDKKVFVTLAAINVSLGFFLYFYAMGVFNSVQEVLQENIFPDATLVQKSFFASSLLFGGTIGAILTEVIGKKLGRKSTLIISNIISLVGVAFTMLPNILFFILGRTLVGFNGGVSITLVNIYITEISRDPLRGQLGVIPNLAGALALLVAFLAGDLMPYFVEHGIPEAGCRLLLAVPALINIIEIFNLIFLFDFETPFYLVTQNRESEAKDVLRLLYQTRLTLKLDEIKNEKEYVYKEAYIPLKDILLPSGKYWKSFLFSLPLGLSQSTMGAYIPFMFSNMVFSEGMETSYTSFSLTLTTIIGVLNVLGNLIALFLIKHVGRRPLAITGFTLISSINLAITIIIYADSIANMAAKVFILVWIVVFSITLQPLSFLYPAEILPEKGFGIINAVSFIVGFIIVQIFIPLQVLIGYGGIYAIFTCFALMGLIIASLNLVETKGKSKLEVYNLYGVPQDKEEEKEEEGSLVLLEKAE